MPIGYVAGKFRGKTHYEMLEYQRRAEKLSLWLWSQGIPNICPHLNSANFHGLLDDLVWLEGYLEILEVVDTVYVIVEHHSESEGTRQEIIKAEILGKDIIYIEVDDLDISNLY